MHSLRTAFFALGLTAAAGIAACGGYDDYDTGSNPPPPETQATVIAASGAISEKLDEFRTLLGNPANGGTAGEQPSGRREISWDGAAANPFNNKNDFPAFFFNSSAKNGVLFTTPGTGFRNDSLRFAEVNPGYADQFETFSPTKVFAPVGSNIMEVLFQVAGQPSPASVTGFGAVFSDVDVAGSSSIEFFDVAGNSLAKVLAPMRSDKAGLSFIGAVFAQPIVARVRITLGAAPLGAGVNDVSAGGLADLVVVDNFVYGEPKLIR